jgi:anti-anti-sigma factor
VDLSRVSFMDSSGLGALVGLEKLAREYGRKFRPAAPSGPVLTLIKQAHMQGFFSMAEALPAPSDSMAAGSNPALSVDAVESARLLEISLSGRLDADVADKLRSSLFELADKNPEAPSLRLDMTGVIFIDSSGLAALIALHKRLRAEGRSMSVANLSGDAARIFRIMNMEKYLDIA